MGPRFQVGIAGVVLGALTLSHAQGQSSASGVSTTLSSQGSSTSFRPIFTVPASVERGQPLLPNVQDPQAVDPQTVCSGYVASDAVSSGSGLTAKLSLAGQACNVYGTDIDYLNLIVEYQSKDRLHVEIVPAYIDASNESYFILPEHLVRKPTSESNNVTDQNSDLKFTWDNEPSFSFSVERRSTGDVLFSTKGRKLVFENQFIEFGSDLPKDYNIYGLGEVIRGLRLGNNLTRTLWNADVGDPVDGNLYGSHPFYLETRYTNGNTANATTSRSHGVYLRNAHGQEVLLRPQGITWRTIGGSIDLYFFAGPTQPEVSKSYQRDAIGLPAMQQYFTLGYHQCRWGYHNWSELQDVVDNFDRFGIPLDNIWSDIDYMNQYRDFENDLNTHPYEEGQAFLQRLHDSGRHWIPIVDAAIYVPSPANQSDAYPTFERGNDTASYLRNPDESLYIGAVWPGYTVFPDMLSQGGQPWWIGELETWHEKIAFDGVWLDMNEASSFCVGSCGSNNLTLNPVHPPFNLPGEPGSIIYTYPEDFNVTNATEAATASSLSSAQAAAATGGPAGPATTPTYLRTTPTPGVRDINYPPYVINNIQGVDLAVHGVSPNATHADGTLEYDVHNLYGHQLINATYQALLKIFPGKRPFIIGRSTFAGSGTLAGHWGGDNYSRWAYMFFSIAQALSFSLFGIPMFGTDVCGFIGNTDMELCNRWMQMAAFFPFYRNHNVLSANPQEPYVWASVIDASKRAMSIRYSILPYMYTLFHQAHTTGTLVLRALAWEFPNEPSLASADRQFLLGPSILVTPVLTPGATTVDGVFPGIADGTIWYDWYNQTAVTVAAGENKTIDAPLGHIPVYVRGGSVLPMQEPALTTHDSRRKPWAVLAALSGQGTAAGELYVDDGESLEPQATLLVRFDVADGALIASRRGSYPDANPLANVTVLGVAAGASVGRVELNGRDVGSGSWSFDESRRVLAVTGLSELTAEGAWGGDWSLRWS